MAVYEKVFCLVWSWQKCFPLLCLYHTRLGCLCAIVRWWEELHCVVVRRTPLLSMRGKHCEARSRFRGEVKARLSEISGQYLFSSLIQKLFAPILWMMTIMTMTTVRWPRWPIDHDESDDHEITMMTKVAMTVMITMTTMTMVTMNTNVTIQHYWVCPACITVFSFQSC